MKLIDDHAHALHGHAGQRPWLAWLLLPVVLAAAMVLTPAAALAGAPDRFSCDGDLLLAQLESGAVDALGIPNTTAGTVPGAFVVLRWRDLTLQLPRSNDAGAPLYTDGKWTWGGEDPDHPRFTLRRAGVEAFSCTRCA